MEGLRILCQSLRSRLRGTAETTSERRGTFFAKSVGAMAMCALVKPTRDRGSRRGFTLIEMMIVVAILGLVSMLAVSNMSRAQKRKNVQQQIVEVWTAISYSRSLADLAGA